MPMTKAMIREMETALGTLPDGEPYAQTGWMLPDGRLLNLAPPASRRHEPGYCGPRMSHQLTLDHVFTGSGLRVADALAAGLVRIVPEGCGLQAVRPMTPEQLATATTFFTAHRRYGMQFELGVGDELRVIDYPDDADPEAVVADIQRRLVEHASKS